MAAGKEGQIIINLTTELDGAVRQDVEGEPRRAGGVAREQHGGAVVKGEVGDALAGELRREADLVVVGLDDPPALLLVEAELGEVALDDDDLVGIADDVHPLHLPLETLPPVGGPHGPPEVGEALALDAEGPVALERIVALAQCTDLRDNPLGEGPRCLLPRVDDDVHG